MSDRLQINAVARPRPTPAPKMQAPAATIVLKDGGKYVLLNGEVVTMKAIHGEFLSDQGWYYRADGKFTGEHNNPLYKRHVAGEIVDGRVIIPHDEAREFWLGGGTVLYRNPKLHQPLWSVFPPPSATINAQFFNGYRHSFEWSKQA